MSNETKDNPLLEIRGIRVSVDETEILKGIDLTVNVGEVHAIMGPNGSGKSTLASVLAGRPEHKVTEGQVLYQGEDLLSVLPEIRARNGIFLAFQYPLELPGVRTWQFLKAAVDSIRAHRGLEALRIRDFDKLLEEKREIAEMVRDRIAVEKTVAQEEEHIKTLRAVEEAARELQGARDGGLVGGEADPVRLGEGGRRAQGGLEAGLPREDHQPGAVVGLPRAPGSLQPVQARKGLVVVAEDGDPETPVHHCRSRVVG